MAEKRMKICLAASSGGHLTQLLKVKDVWQGYEVFCVSSAAIVREKLERFGRTYIVNECNRKHPVKSLRVLFQCLSISVKERPSVVISTGAAPGILMCLTARLFSAKIVWLDSIANTERLSMSGRMVRPFAGLMLSQWPDVAAKYKDVEYAGAVI